MTALLLRVPWDTSQSDTDSDDQIPGNKGFLLSVVLRMRFSSFVLKTFASETRKAACGNSLPPSTARCCFSKAAVRPGEESGSRQTWGGEEPMRGKARTDDLSEPQEASAGACAA